MLAVLALAVTATAGDKVYKYVDEHGNLNYVDSEDKIPPKYLEHSSEQTPSGNLSIVETPRQQKKAAPPAAGSAQKRAGNKQQPARKTYRTNAQIELYATSWCGYCEKARKYFKQHNLAYTEYDIEQDAAAARRMRQLSNQGGVPVIKIDDRVLTGFSANALDELLLQ